MTPRGGRTVLVVPCFNEARRLDGPAFSTLLEDPAIDLLFVDDGSSDDTRGVLQALAAQHTERIEVLVLDRNQGKAEAVRQGLLAALQRKPAIVGYTDADLATPPAELRRLVELLRRGEASVLFGARVALLGRDIDRSPTRHYLGRIFATAASFALGADVYDTQCGAKLFRAIPELEQALQDRFGSRWVFDVELLGRLLVGSPSAAPLPPSSFVEEPLRVWKDVKGSKLGPGQMLGAVADLAMVRRDLRRRRALVTAGTTRPPRPVG